MIDKETATRIIRNTFEKTFDKTQFINFSKNLVNKLDTSRNFSYQGNYIPDAYKPYIQTLERIGQYQDSDSKTIEVLIVQLKKETSLEYARTMQRNFIAWYLGGSRGGEFRDAALVAVISPESEDWRFSLVKMEYNLGISEETGRLKTEKFLTPARRYSFLVGSNESSHTAQTQLLPILQDDLNNPTLAELENAFSIEVVTKEFFTRYRTLFHNVEEAFKEAVKHDVKAKQALEANGIDTVNFAKKLLGQTVFLYFLQKKGWLGVPEDKKWGDGDRCFLRSLFDRAIESKENFFNEYLEYLFYDALARQERGTVDPAYYPRFNCKIPFLNGGLFDPINNYDWKNDDILLTNKLFSNNENTKAGDIGTGILDVFDRYNFTVKEDEPLDKDVAVDPEMLGKVFENLLEVKDRKSKGTYYTPREIVHYMCQESLINYLDTALNTNEVSRKDIEAFIRMGELAIEHDTWVETYGKETERYSYKLPESIRRNARIIDDKLAEIRVCDPAIGSGAFPVGLMTEIVRARNTLTTYMQDKTGRTNYNFKRHVIQNCLYGVDIDLGAVEIAKLRLWLSLVVDEEDIKQIQPLPNLDYKVVCGNSLLGVERNMFNNELFQKLEELKPLYFNETNAKKKQEIRRQIDQLIKELTNNKEAFDFEVYFSEVFHEKNGFDIVIANPPYVSFGLHNSKNAAKEWATLVRKLYPGSAEYKISLYALFVDLAVRIARNGGVVCYITPDSFLLGRYFSKLRKTLLDHTSINRIVMFEKDFWKSGVVGRPTISLYQKRVNRQLTTCILAQDEKAFSSNNILQHEYSHSYFRNVPHNRFRLFFAPIAKRFVETIESGTKPLNSVARITTGVRSKTKQDEIVSITCLGTKWKRGIISGSQVRRYRVEWDGHFLNIDGDLLFSGGWDKNIIENPKIMIRQTGDSIIAGIDLNSLYHLNNVHSLHLISTNVSLPYICALLNSRLMNRYYHLISLEYKRTMAQTDIETLELLPYREPDTKTLQKINSLYLNINELEAENEIERILASLYCLDKELLDYLAGDEFYPQTELI